MVYPLPQGECEGVRPLFAVLDHHLAVNAAIEGTAPAGIYVDDPGRPTAAMIWGKNRFFLAGSPHQEVFNEGTRRLFADQVYPQVLAARGKPMFVLYYSPRLGG